ncbi:MAG: RraA family protein [Rhodospirillales bacterium]|nr:RraA family protein [Rhodospirillales bacterium]
MIEEPPVLTLRRHFQRPTRAQVAAFKGVQTGFVVDAMQGRGALDGRIKAVSDEQAEFCGVAVTAFAGPADIMAAFAAIEIAGPGDIVVVATDAYEATAVAGDNMLGIAQNRGVEGFVTDGFVRDVTGIRRVGLPCFCAGVTPNSPACNGPGTVGQNIVLGGVSVNSGDIIVGDLDGVVVVPFANIDAIIARLDVVRAAEAELDAKVRGGLKIAPFMEEIFNSGKIREID